MSIEDNLKVIKDAKLDIELLRRENEKKCMENNQKIDNLSAVIKDAEEMLEINLRESGQKKLECKLGWCAFRVMPDKWDYMDSEIIAWCKKDGKPYYKTIEVVKKFELKKDIQNGIFKYEVPSNMKFPGLLSLHKSQNLTTN